MSTTVRLRSGLVPARAAGAVAGSHIKSSGQPARRVESSAAGWAASELHRSSFEQVVDVLAVRAVIVDAQALALATLASPHPATRSRRKDERAHPRPSGSQYPTSRDGHLTKWAACGLGYRSRGVSAGTRGGCVGSRSPFSSGQAGDVAEASRPTVRVVRRKSDGTVSAVDSAYRLTAPGDERGLVVLARQP